MPINNQTDPFSSTLTITNQVGELLKVAMWLEQVANDFQLPDPLVLKLDIVLNEALPNIISYAYHDSEPHDIIIKLENNEDFVSLEIRDDGLAFDPFSGPEFLEAPSLALASCNGRGIHLIKSYTDHQQYRRIDNRNIMQVTIIKSSMLKNNAQSFEALGQA